MKEKNLLFKRAMLALCLLAVCWIPARAEVIPGDVDGSGKVNIADVTELIDLLFNYLVDVDLYPAADVDGNGVIGIADVVELIDMLLQAEVPQDDHEWVDLGLPSGTLWATCNVGADKPEDYGDYFAWGETEPKDYYDWSTYKWCNGSNDTMTKYCANSSYGYNGFTDDKTELDPEDDAAYVNWGENWRMPTTDQQLELITNCTHTWTQLNGVNGMLVTGPNGNTLFVPAAGYRWGDYLRRAGTDAFCWSCSFDPGQTTGALGLHFSSGNLIRILDGRRYGDTVRPVRVSQN